MKMKTVYFPIDVPDGDYCYGPASDGKPALCDYLRNGCRECALFFRRLDNDEKGILKADICARLEESKS